MAHESELDLHIFVLCGNEFEFQEPACNVEGRINSVFLVDWTCNKLFRFAVQVCHAVEPQLLRRYNVVLGRRFLVTLKVDVSL